MKIILVRHAIAEDRLSFQSRNKDDGLRPLTRKGKKRMRKGSLGLRWMIPRIDYLLSSPLVRAAQTAEILALTYPEATRVRATCLAPGGEPQEVADELQRLPQDSTVVLVGHEPDLSVLAAWLCNGSAFSFLDFKKGAACLLESITQPGPASTMMQWALTPRQLRDMGEHNA